MQLQHILLMDLDIFTLDFNHVIKLRLKYRDIVYVPICHIDRKLTKTQAIKLIKAIIIISFRIDILPNCVNYHYHQRTLNGSKNKKPKHHHIK